MRESIQEVIMVVAFLFLVTSVTIAGIISR